MILKMKFEEGRSYGKGFWIFAGLWVVLSLIPYPKAIQDPTSFAFGVLIIGLVLIQLASRVCLDWAWVASVTYEKSKSLYIAMNAAETVIAVLAISGLIKTG